jgi:hypothetical protein
MDGEICVAFDDDFDFIERFCFCDRRSYGRGDEEEGCEC